MSTFFINLKKFLIAGFAIIALTTENYQTRPKAASSSISMEVSRNIATLKVQSKNQTSLKIKTFINNNQYLNIAHFYSTSHSLNNFYHL